MANDDRAARLKAALRENLKRRKAQSRGRAASDEPADGPAAEPSSTGDGDAGEAPPEKGHGSHTTSPDAYRISTRRP